MIGVIGGSGLYEMPGFSIVEAKRVRTPYGDPSDEYVVGDLEGESLVFLARHAQRHSIPPHRVNFRANMFGFSELGVERVIAVNAVGGINSRYKVGDIVIPDQIIDMTRSRASTFYDGEDVVHVDFTEPYCPDLRQSFFSITERDPSTLIDGGTYVCTDGPRLETAAEIHFFRTIGGDVVGMTGMPEAILARELQLCYVTLAVVTNFAAGISGMKVTATEVRNAMNLGAARIHGIIAKALSVIAPERGCSCRTALRDARIQ